MKIVKSPHLFEIYYSNITSKDIAKHFEKFILKQNYQFMEGGIIINMTQYPIITIKFAILQAVLLPRLSARMDITKLPMRVPKKAALE